MRRKVQSAMSAAPSLPAAPSAPAVCPPPAISARSALSLALGCGCLALCLTLPNSAFAGDIGNSRNYGFGLVGGSSTTGVTAKYYMTGTKSLQAFAGLHRGDGFALSADWVRDMRNILRWSHSRLMWGVGGGIDLWLHDADDGISPALGLHGVAQVSWHMESWPFEAVFDWRPGWYVGGSDASGLSVLGVGLALRYYF